MATDVAAGFPQVVLQPGSTITVTLDDASAKVTRLSVHGWQQPAAGTVVEGVVEQPWAVPVEA